MATARFVESLRAYRDLVVDVSEEDATTTVSSLLAGPSQLQLLRALKANAPDGKLADAFSEALRSWHDGILVTDGSRKRDPSRLAARCTEWLNEAVAIKKKEEDPYFHDALHVASKLIRTVRFVLRDPARRTGSVSFRFPKSESRLRLLAAARRFFDRTETEEQRADLKRLFGVEGGLCEVDRRDAVYAFQSERGLHLLTPYHHSTISKEEATVEDLQRAVREASGGG